MHPGRLKNVQTVHTEPERVTQPLLTSSQRGFARFGCAEGKKIRLGCRHAGRVGWRAIGDAALVSVLREEHVALHAPRLAPRVLHLPVRLAARGAVADGEDAVV